MTSNHRSRPHHPDDHEAHAGQHPSPQGSHRDFDAQWWEHHYEDTAAAAGRPSAQLVAEVAGVTPGTVLDAGCGTGADAVWLARHGWDVTAVDVSPTAVQHARTFAAQHEPDVAGRIAWLVADLTVWQPPKQYDLVLSQYLHPDMPFGDFAARLAQAVAPGGTLLIVGHDRADSHSAAHAPQTASIGPDAVIRALDPNQWDVAVAEARTRQVTHGSSQLIITDMVVKAHRTPSVSGHGRLPGDGHVAARWRT
jgi:2-polyprenyl-3-methyl-5-hydroxy-6-metoxy-1,4-benzoquinol methylase